jgi:AcrR family transcriptional regulator
MAKKGYHHGDLREELIRTALANLADQRVHDMSLRKLACQVGVDHSAVYRHFENREALLAAMIEVGYRQLNAAVAEAWRSPGSWMTRLHLVLKTHLQFAQTNPHLYELMFNSGLDEAHYPALRQVSIEGATMFVTYLQQAQADGMLLGNEPKQMALTMCSMCQGLARMLLSNQFDGPFVKADENLDQLVDRVIACMNVKAGEQ